MLGSSYLMSLTCSLSLSTFSHMLYSVACTLAELCVAKISSVVSSTLLWIASKSIPSLPMAAAENDDEWIGISYTQSTEVEKMRSLTGLSVVYSSTQKSSNDDCGRESPSALAPLAAAASRDTLNEQICAPRES